MPNETRHLRFDYDLASDDPEMTDPQNVAIMIQGTVIDLCRHGAELWGHDPFDLLARVVNLCKPADAGER